MLMLIILPQYFDVCYAKMGSVKDRNCMYLTGAEYIKKRRQKYTENYTKKIFMI